jgi:hypothetical protein
MKSARPLSHTGHFFSRTANKIPPFFIFGFCYFDASGGKKPFYKKVSGLPKIFYCSAPPYCDA